GLVRSMVINIMFGRVFGPIGHWIESASALPESREVREVDAMIRRAPTTVTLWIGALWAVQLVAGTLILLLFDRYHAAIPPRSLVTAVLMAAAVFLGTIPFTTPLMSLLLASASRTLFALSHKAGIRLHRDPSSLKIKLIVQIASIGLAGPVWMTSTSYTADAARAQTEARSQCVIAASELARKLGSIDLADSAALSRAVRQASVDGLVASVANSDGVLLAGDRPASPPLAKWSETAVHAPGPNAPPAPPSWMASPRDGEIAGRATASNGLVAIVTTSIPDGASSSMVFLLVMFFLVVITWAPMCAYFLARHVVDPLLEITQAVRQITEVGKLDEVSAITVSANDENGALAARFNDLLETLRDLSSAAGALAKGDLEIRLSGEGDVAVAFRAMIESLGRIVRQIHETSVLLAAAATEIYAASQEQEAAAASQSTAMVEIRQTMESLFEAAAHVSESVRGVLSNAERTLETTDRMVVRIGDLTNHASRIGEILETIRDISDRSDLLALNGALEASRAGEAGRGFGLVAAEMRRLAERVMSSTHDVRSLVGDIRASGSSTMMATEDSKKLAASTTDAARQITLVTQQQRSGTEQVLQSVREIAETLTQSVAAMAQTRASAEQLKSQADKLSTLVRAFRIETPAS
ncbi:MAG TPA: methyl-accepting chemotaxis protein, partial [Kofleriaceae bacterium]|nr:methyl-accepting chemotaxis protein [Kofleriaceae bacterium]